MIKQILIAGILMITIIPTVSAYDYTTYSWNVDGEGVYTRSGCGQYAGLCYYNNNHDVYIKWYASSCTLCYNIYDSFGSGSFCTCTGCGAPPEFCDEGIQHLMSAGYAGRHLQLTNWYTSPLITMNMIVSETPFTEYTISGNTSCVNDVELHIHDGSGYVKLTTNTTVNPYSLNVLNGSTYKIIFNGVHEYGFTVNNSSIVYDYDGCTHTQYRFEESCGNLIPDSEGIFVEWLSGSWLAITPFHASNGILDISNSSATAITMESETFIGATRWGLDPVVSNTTYVLKNTNINWKLKVIVQNESDGELIEGAMVKVDQTCYCTAGNSSRQKKTVSGMSQFEDMSLQDASLFVMASGYKILDENSTGYNVFLSGRAGFESKTWIVELANSSSNNSSTWYESEANTTIYFKDENGNRTSQILDTDTYVDLYYFNNNTDESNMTLKFQSSSTHTYFVDERTYNIPYGETGYKRITTGYFTPQSYSYRAIMYNSSIYGWNITIPLTVRNGTREEEGNYQNLTTNMWVVYAEDGKIDYREDMRIAVHAKSVNTTLMTIDVELWDNGVYKKKVNLTATDFSDASIPYLYMWSPSYNYETGHNYSVRMYGYDRTLLETDYVECITDTVTRKNKITIKVKDRAGNNLNNAYVYLEDWGSLSTGSTNYNVYEGITNGDYRYKATKSGYTGDGWEEITINDGDEFVVYTLTGDYTNTSMTAQKFGDEEIKSFFFPLMYFLLICIVLGGLKYVTQ